MSNVTHYIGKIQGKSVIVGVKLKETEDNQMLYTVADMLSDKQVVKKLNDNGAALLYKVIEVGAITFPALTVSAKPSNPKLLDTLPLELGMASMKGDKDKENEVLNKVISKQESWELNLTEFEEISKDLVSSFLDARKAELHIEVEPTALSSPTDMPKLVGFKVNMKEENKRIKKARYENTAMQEPTDTVMFRLSRYDAINNAVQMEDSSRLNYPNFKNFIPFFRNVKGMDSKAWEKHLTMFGDDKITKEDVLGYSHNNDLEIQDNEKDFYNQMVDMIKEGVAKERAVSMEEVDKLLADGITSKNANNYLLELIQLALYQTRNYTAKVTVPSQLTLDEDEAGDEETGAGEVESVTGESMDSLYYYADAAGTKQVPITLTEEESLNAYNSSGYDAIKSYVSKVASNPFALAEVLVKLLRWGERRPTSLAVTGAEKNGNQLYLDLTTFKETTFSGDWGKEVPKVVNGCKYFIEGKITIYKSAGSVAYLRTQDKFSSEGDVPAQFDVIAGVQLLVVYEGGEYQKVYMDMDTFIEHVKTQVEGEKIQGTRYDATTGKVVIDASAEEAFNRSAILAGTVLNEINSADNNRQYIEVNKELMELAMSIEGLELGDSNIFGIWESYISSNSLEEEVRKGDFSTRQEMLEGLRNREILSGVQGLQLRAMNKIADRIVYVQILQLEEGIRDAAEVGLGKAIELFEAVQKIKNRTQATQEQPTQAGASTQTEEPLTATQGVQDMLGNVGGEKTSIMTSDKPKLAKAIPLAETPTSTPVAWFVPNKDGSMNLYAVEEVEVEAQEKFVPVKQLVAINKLRTSNPEGFNKKFKLHSSETMMKINSKYNELYA